jgi:hypothetical protein
MRTCPVLMLRLRVALMADWIKEGAADSIQGWPVKAT